MTTAAYAQVGREEETYVAGYVCTRCKGTFFGGISHDPERRGQYPLSFRFCPVCGAEFSGEIPRAEASERHRELRAQAGWKNRTLAEARKITYVVETTATMDKSGWAADAHWRYPEANTPSAAVALWRDRLAQGSLFGEDVRLLARTPRGEKVIFGPVHLEGRTWKEVDE